MARPTAPAFQPLHHIVPMSTNLLRPLAFSEILDGAFTLYRRHFVTFFATALVCFVPLSVISFLLGGGEAVTGGAGIGILVLFVAMVVALVGGWAALTWQAAQGINGQPLSVGDGFRHGLRAFLPLLGGLVVGYLALSAVATAAAMLVGLAVGIAAVAAGTAATFALGIAAGLILVVLFTLGLAALFAVPAAVVVERLGPIAALRRSWGLASGAWGRVVGVVLVAWIIVMLPTMGLYAVGAGTGLFSLSETGMQNPTWAVIESSASFLISALTYPFFVAATTLLYFDRRVRSEAYDLELATDGLAMSR
jgi:hypothetical protein